MKYGYLIHMAYAQISSRGERATEHTTKQMFYSMPPRRGQPIWHGTRPCKNVFSSTTCALIREATNTRNLLMPRYIFSRYTWNMCVCVCVCGVLSRLDLLRQTSLRLSWLYHVLCWFSVHVFLNGRIHLIRTSTDLLSDHIYQTSNEWRRGIEMDAFTNRNYRNPTI